jgi:hypothetical protein
VTKGLATDTPSPPRPSVPLSLISFLSRNPSFTSFYSSMSLLLSLSPLLTAGRWISGGAGRRWAGALRPVGAWRPSPPASAAAGRVQRALTRPSPPVGSGVVRRRATGWSGMCEWFFLWFGSQTHVMRFVIFVWNRACNCKNRIHVLRLFVCDCVLWIKWNSCLWDEHVNLLINLWSVNCFCSWGIMKY